MIKFPNKSYKPKQLLHWCAEEESFDEVIVVGVTEEGRRVVWHTSSQAFGFLSMAYFCLMGLVNDQLGQKSTKRR